MLLLGAHPIPSASHLEKYLTGNFTIYGVLLQVKCKSKYRSEEEGNFTASLMQSVGRSGLKVVQGKSSLKSCQLYEQLKECLWCSVVDTCPVKPGLSGLLSFAPMEPNVRTVENSLHGCGTRSTWIHSPASATDVVFPQASHFSLLCLQIFFLCLQILGCKLFDCFSYVFYRIYCRHGACKSEALDVPAVILEVPSPAPVASQHTADKPGARPRRGVQLLHK